MKKKIVSFVFALAFFAGFTVIIPPINGQGDFIFEMYSTALLYPDKADDFATSYRSHFDHNFFACTQNLKESFLRLESELDENCERWNGRNENRYRQCKEENYAVGVADIISDLERLAQGTPWANTASGHMTLMLAQQQQQQYQKGYADYYVPIAAIYGRKTANQLMVKYENEVFEAMVEKLNKIRPHFNCVWLP